MAASPLADRGVLRDLLRSMALLLCRGLQAEEERTRPAYTRDLSRDLRKRAESFTEEVNTIVQHGHTMSDSVPFPNEHGSRLQRSSGWLSQGAPLRPVPAPALEQVASGGLEAADGLFLQPIAECFDQQVAANPARSLGPEQSASGLVQLFRAEVPEISISAEIPSRSDNEHFIGFPLLLRVDTHIAHIAGYSQSWETTPERDVDDLR